MTMAARVYEVPPRIPEILRYPELEALAAAVGYHAMRCPSCCGASEPLPAHQSCPNCGGSGRLWQNSSGGTLADGGLARLAAGKAR